MLVICQALFWAQWLWQEQWRLHCLLSCGLWSRGEDRCSSNQHTSDVCAQIVMSHLKEGNMIYNIGDSFWMDEGIWKGLFWEIGFKLWPAREWELVWCGAGYWWGWRVHGAGRLGVRGALHSVLRSLPLDRVCLCLWTDSWIGQWSNLIILCPFKNWVLFYTQ